MFRYAGVNNHHSNTNVNLLLSFNLFKNSIIFFLKKKKIHTPRLECRAKDGKSEMHLELLKKQHSNLLYLNSPLLQFTQCITTVTANF